MTERQEKAAEDKNNWGVDWKNVDRREISPEAAGGPIKFQPTAEVNK